MLPYVIGLLVGVLGFARVLEYLFAHFPVPTAFAFVGLILGAVPMLSRHVKNSRVRFGDMIAFVAMAAIVIVLPLLQGGGGTVRTLSMNLWDMLLLVLLGMIASATMVGARRQRFYGADDAGILSKRSGSRQSANAGSGGHGLGDDGA